MAEQTADPRDKGQYSETADGGQFPGQHSPLPAQHWELGEAADVSGLPAGPTPTRSPRKVIVIAAAAVVLVGGGIALGITLTSGGPALPATVAGLTRDDSSDASHVTGQVTSELGVLQGLIVHPEAALYGNSGHDTMLIVTAPWSNSAKADGFVSDISAAAVGGLTAQGVTDAAPFPAGPRGGSLACGHTTISGQSFVVCSWADGKMLGVTFYLGSSSSLSDAAAKTIQVRSDVEH